MIGQRLGSYEIVGKLGEGGMGEVWRARDTRLQREVAIKVVPESFAQDADRLARFEREARLLAQLNHPNIAQVHGLEVSGDTRALVMELVEGPTLADRLEQGDLAPDETLRIARQIAEALEEAHGKGIIHRDLKPANIKASSEGRVKVLDFGLAKALLAEVADDDSRSLVAASPTLTLGATAQGLVLGTAAYMAPEQAKGGRVDKRADIWGFGVVLFEMITGGRLFAADTVPETLAQVLTAEPDLERLPDSTGPALRRLLRRCLERDPHRRLHDIADARILLVEILEGVEEPPPQTVSVAGAPGRRPGWAVVVGAAFLVVAAVSAGLTHWLGREEKAAPRPMHLTLTCGPDQEVQATGNSQLAFSPDGQTLVFSGLDHGQKVLLRRDLGGDEAVAIPGTENGEAAFFSPDGRWLGFAADGELMKVPLGGGKPIALADSRGSGGATWLSDDTLIFAPIYSDGLYRIPATGGEAEALTEPERREGVLGHWWPDPLPGERKILYTAFRTPVDRSRIGVLDLDTMETKTVIDGGIYGHWVDTGHLLYAHESRIYAVPFDPVEAEVTGSPVSVREDLLVDATGGNAMFAVSSEGLLAYVTESQGNPLRELVWLDRQGRPQSAAREKHRYLSVDLSPDGGEVAVSIEQDSRDLWVLSLERGTLSRLTTSSATEFDPVWSGDGSELFYVVDVPPFVLHRIGARAIDSGHPIWQEKAELDTTGIDVGGNGKWAAYTVSEAVTGSNIYVRPLDGSEGQRPFRAGRTDESLPKFSPDGRWLAYQSKETGRLEVYVEAFPGPGDRFRISSDGGYEPVWSPDGRELFFRRADEFWVAEVTLGGDFRFGEPRLLFAYPVIDPADSDTRTYAVTRDRQHLLVVSVPDALRPRHLEIVTHWAQQLRWLAPSKGS